MNKPSQLDSFTGGRETGVDVAGIERQLAALWEQAAGSGPDPDRPAVTRACLFNFLVFCGTPEHRERAVETIVALTSRHPCRAILLVASPDQAAPSLSASITAHCHLAGNRQKQVCCEQIAIEAGGDRVADLPSAVLPLLESDLPAVLWWQGNFMDYPRLFEGLVPFVDQVFFDTAVWSDASPHPDALSRLQAMMDQSEGSCFVDLNWTRTGMWREMTAQCFDHPDYRPELTRIRSAKVVYRDGPGLGMRALLLAGWFAAQLKWTSDVAASRIQMEVRPPDEARPPGIIAVEFKSEQVTFAIRGHYRHGSATSVIIVPHGRDLPRERAFGAFDDPSMISWELDHFSRHTVYRRALGMAASLASVFSVDPR